MTNRGPSSPQQSISLVAAIKEKYGCCDLQPGLILPSDGDHLSVFMKFKPVDNLCNKKRGLLVLNDQNIDCAGDPEVLTDLLTDVTDLDISKNKFSSWAEYFSDQNLQELHLSYNDFSNLVDESTLTFPTTSSSTTKCLRSDDSPSFCSVHVLYLNGCHIRTWSVLLRICRLFPCLEILVAPENPIQTIEKDNGENLACLHALNMNRWLLTSWEDVDGLTNLPMLNELRAAGIPFLEKYSENERRLLLVARLKDLTLLNGSTIGPTIREEAERFFIRYYMDETEKPSRYYELINLHGCLNKLLDVDLSPKRHADVRLVYSDENRIENRKIQLNQSVAQFKKSLRNFCNLPPNRIRLFYVDVEVVNVYGMEELRYPGVMLHALRVTDGDEFHIQAKPEQPQTIRRSRNSGSSGCDRSSGT
uniref:Tubulin-specific chaperone cofactor E-like protein n=1 Tax=Romanomermis culicivorax TaxID=13658 RepID=A0A915KFA5_ROMCU